MALLFDVVCLSYSLRSIKASTRTCLIVDSLISVSLLPALVLAAAGSLFHIWRSAVRDQGGAIVCDHLNLFAEECAPIFYQLGRLQLAAVATAAIVW